MKRQPHDQLTLEYLACAVEDTLSQFSAAEVAVFAHNVNWRDVMQRMVVFHMARRCEEMQNELDDCRATVPTDYEDAFEAASIAWFNGWQADNVSAGVAAALKRGRTDSLEAAGGHEIFRKQNFPTGRHCLCPGEDCPMQRACHPLCGWYAKGAQ